MRPVCEIEMLNVDPLADEARFALWMDRMPETRREKVGAFRFPEGRRLSLGAGILLYRALERRGIDGTGVRIGTEEYGRPVLTDYPEIHFSLSHSGRWAVCAVAADPVGCDVEEGGRGRAGIPERFFHPEEREMLAVIRDPVEWNRAFTRVWTRKESYLKATGKGLTEPMSGFSTLGEVPGRWFGEPAEGETGFTAGSMRSGAPAGAGTGLMTEHGMSPAAGPEIRAAAPAGPGAEGYAVSCCVLSGMRPEFRWRIAEL